jgi:hypothetical protein
MARIMNSGVKCAYCVARLRFVSSSRETSSSSSRLTFCLTAVSRGILRFRYSFRFGVSGRQNYFLGGRKAKAAETGSHLAATVLGCACVAGGALRGLVVTFGGPPCATGGITAGVTMPTTASSAPTTLIPASHTATALVQPCHEDDWVGSVKADKSPSTSDRAPLEPSLPRDPPPRRVALEKPRRRRDRKATASSRARKKIGRRSRGNMPGRRHRSE